MAEINNNPLIDSYNLIEQVIRTYVTDPNSLRRGKTEASERQWIFPEVPESIDQFYPRIAILLNNFGYSENGAGRLHDIYNEANTQTVSGNWAVLELQVTLFIKKKELYEVSYEGSDTKMRNKLLASFLINEISKQLDINRDFFITQKQADMTVGTIGDVYEDTNLTWAVDLPITISMPNTWVQNFTTGELIATINTIINTSR